MIDLVAIQKLVVAEFHADSAFKKFDDKKGDGIPLLVVPEEYTNDDAQETARVRVTFPSVITTGKDIWEADVLLSFTYQVRKADQYQTTNFIQKVLERANQLGCMKLDEVTNTAAGFIDEAETIYAVRVDCKLEWKT